jgi:hypothetical protein
VSSTGAEEREPTRQGSKRSRKQQGAANSIAGMANAEAPKTTPGRLRRDPEAAAIYNIAWEEGRRRVDDQLAELEGIRTRSLQYLALTLTATAFLVGSSIRTAERDLLFYSLAGAATACAFFALCLGLVVLLGRWWFLGTRRLTWKFRMSGQALVDWAEHEVPSPPSEAVFTRALAKEYDKMFEHNANGLRIVRNLYAVAVALAFVSVLTWVALVWFRG